jgi:hypothetical protein
VKGGRKEKGDARGSDHRWKLEPLNEKANDASPSLFASFTR